MAGRRLDRDISMAKFHRYSSATYASPAIILAVIYYFSGNYDKASDYLFHTYPRFCYPNSAIYFKVNGDRGVRNFKIVELHYFELHVPACQRLKPQLMAAGRFNLRAE